MNKEKKKEKTTALPRRADVPKALTWDLSSIFETDEAFEQAFSRLSERMKEAASYQGRIQEGGSAFLEVLEFFLSVYREVEPLYVYAHLKNDQDTADSAYQSMYGRAGSLMTEISETLAWFEPEVLALSDEEIGAYIKEEPKLERYRFYIEDLIRSRSHILPSEMETLVAGAGEVLSAAGDIFSVINNADFRFPEIKDEKGHRVRLSHGLYGKFLESTDRRVRKDAFQGVYGVYKQFQNTLATVLSTQIKSHNYMARIRHYKNAREAALFSGRIPESVYDTLVDVVEKNLPLLHRYVSLRKKQLNLSDLHMYDMYTPLLGEAPVRFSYKEAKEIALCGLEPLGEEYAGVLKEAFSKRWIDVAENRGKRSGAYSSGAYDTAPFILLNWHDSMDQLFTLVHELGHSVHSHFTRKNQPFVYGDYSIFLAEIASTTNENILTEYLLKTQTDPRVRAYILNHYLDGFKGTVFRQTQFARFEHFMHEKEAQGEALTSEFLSDHYGRLNADFYGPEVEMDEEIAYEWSRIPHFYYNYYVYQYATGFAAASALAEKIVNGDPGALDKYLTYLKAGSSDEPIEVMKKAGVDMTKPDYLEEAMKQFARRLTELEEAILQFADPSDDG